MDYAEIANVSAPELQRRLAALREQLRTVRFNISQGQHKDVRDIRDIKKDIARIMTRLKTLESQS